MTPTTPPPARRRAGTSLVELLVTTVIFGIVMTTAFSFLLVQTRSYRALATRTDQVQNARFGHDILRQELRTAGTNVLEEQPLIVFASDSVFAFNADLLTNRADSGRFTGAIYVDPYASDAEANALSTANAIVVPGSAFTYPLADYTSLAGTDGEAETIIVYFTPDTSTAESGDYALMRQVNAQPAELVASGLTRAGTDPFFRYWYDPSRYVAGTTELETVPPAWMPLRKSVTRRGLDADTGTAASTRIDQIRAVEVAYKAAQKAGGGRDEIRYTVAMPNVGVARALRACGREPLAPGAPSALWDADSAAVFLSWTRATDDGGGERDALRYVLWRRMSGAATWGAPLATLGVAADTVATYTYRDGGVEAGAGNQYEYVLAVQDCTPNVSPLSGTTSVLIP